MELKKEQLERITKMECNLEQGTVAVKQLTEALEVWGRAQAGIQELDEYYGSKEWFQDLEDDGQSKLPQDLKRGVLSQDLIYDLLMENRALIEKMSEISSQKKENQE